MSVITAEHVAIAELVVYIPIFLLTIWIVLRHGIHKQLGWIHLVIFSIIRVAGAVMEIRSTKDAGNATYKEWTVILQSVGLSPLLLSTLGILKRMLDEILERVPSKGIVGKIVAIYTKRATAISRRSRSIQLRYIPAFIALVLAIIGGTDLASSDTSAYAGAQAKIRAAVILYFLIYLATCGLWAVSVRDFHTMTSNQTRIYLCLLLSLPLLAVRITYSLISDFGNHQKFSFINGDVTVRFAMSTMEELLVIFMYITLGISLP